MDGYWAQQWQKRLCVMQVFVNSSAHDCPEGCTLADLLEQLQLAPASCATAVNGQFVARKARQDRVLAANDQIMTFAPITGG